MKKTNITYEISGIVERSIVINISKATLRINFEGGSINSDGTIPAKYTTGSEAVQNAIEKCPLFKKGAIKRGTEYEIEDPDEKDEEQGEKTDESDNENPFANNNDSTQGNTNPSIFVEVTNVTSAKEILRAKYDVDLAELQNKDAILAKAAELGVEFPNWQ